jgi:hypothetical protein
LGSFRKNIAPALTVSALAAFEVVRPVRQPFSSMKSEVFSNQAIEAHEKNGFVW